MSSHCISAQMLAPPPPGLPRLALPPATKPTSEGGSSSPTSPCKHPGRRPRGAPPLPGPASGVGVSGPARWVPASLVGPQMEAWGPRGQVHTGPRQPEGMARGKSGVRPHWPSGLGPPCPPSGPLNPLPCNKQLAVGEDLKLEVGGPDPAPRSLLSEENENLLW